MRLRCDYAETNYCIIELAILTVQMGKLIHGFIICISKSLDLTTTQDLPEYFGVEAG